MTALPKEKMTVPEFLKWATQQSEGRFELVHGEVVAMAPERNRHAIIKGNIYGALKDAVQNAGLPCAALPDGVTVVINDSTSYEPDATLVCDSKIDLDAVTVENPLLVVEVTSPSSKINDTTGKLADYLTLPSIRHVLIVDPLRKLVMHHARTDGADVLTRILRDTDALSIDPPGLKISVDKFFDGT